MKKVSSVCAAFIFALLILGISNFAVRGQQIVIPLEGLDPVELSQGKEIPGDMKIFTDRGEFRYVFVNEENKAKFEKDPQHYEIQFGATCARMGASFPGNADIYTSYNGRIYVFLSGDCLKEFSASPESYIDPTHAALSSVSPEAIKRGQALIEQAVAALGGADKLDGLTSYKETIPVVQNVRGKEIKGNNVLTIAFPDRIHQQRLFFGTPIAVVITSREAFLKYLSAGVTVPMSQFQIQDEKKRLNRKLIALLRARKTDGFKAASLGPARLGEVTLEQVQVEFDGQSLTVGIDPSTGRVLSLTYRDRGPDFKFGVLVEQYSDYRATGGLVLPYKTTVTFNGTPVPELSYTTDSIIINALIAPEIFEKPQQSKAP